MKKFDEEYKKEIDLEVPDLWDRIEAGVDAFEAEKKNEETGESPAEEETVIKNIRTKNNKKSRGNRECSTKISGGHLDNMEKLSYNAHMLKTVLCDRGDE